MRGKTVSFDEAISRYLTRLPRRFAPRNDDLQYPRNNTSSQ
ncbi:hypothetical protein [Rickettsia hoogstraalii]|nr:hypothetical protein [Rickettsia hoogstraalii]